MRRWQLSVFLALRDELIKVFTPDFHSSREFINFICNDHSLAAPRPPRRPGRIFTDSIIILTL